MSLEQNLLRGMIERIDHQLSLVPKLVESGRVDRADVSVFKSSLLQRKKKLQSALSQLTIKDSQLSKLTAGSASEEDYEHAKRFVVDSISNNV